MVARRLVFLLLVTCIAVAIFAFDLTKYADLTALKLNLHHLLEWKERFPIAACVSFFLLYTLASALSFPGALVLTLAAGALFGAMLGTFIVSFASSIGATMAFLAARFLFRDAIQERFGRHLTAIDDGIRRDGAFYLLTLRLVPIVPFFLVNLLMGITSIRTWTYYWTSQIGMLVGTFVYVNAGTQLAAIDDVSDILSPRLIASFAALGTFPIAAKALTNAIRRRRLFRRWHRPRTFDRNLIIIGGGAAGLVSAYIAATAQARVSLIEAGKMGGDCLNYGCVPSKALIQTAKIAHAFRKADPFGLKCSAPAIDFPAVMQRIHSVIRTIEPKDSVERYRSLGVDVIEGRGRLVDPWTVEIALNDGGIRRLTSRGIIIASGAKPFVPDILGLEEVGYFTSDNIWSEFAKLSHCPNRIAVLGGGPIGCELAQAFARLGSAVTLIEMADRLLIREDVDVSDAISHAMHQDGVQILTSHKAVRCEHRAGDKVLVLELAGHERFVSFDALICAVGRTPHLSGFGLEELGFGTARKLDTTPYLDTLYPNIYAAGDVTGLYQFTHTAAHQAWYATVNSLFGAFKRFRADYSVIPWATFVDPEVGRVGLNEQEATQKGVPFEVTVYDLAEHDRAIADGAAKGFIKVLTVPGQDRILGVTIVGSNAAELLAEFVLAMRHRIGLKKILSTVHIYPTMAEANKHVAGAWRRNHMPQWALPWLLRYHAWRRG